MPEFSLNTSYAHAPRIARTAPAKASWWFGSPAQSSPSENSFPSFVFFLSFFFLFSFFLGCFCGSSGSFSSLVSFTSSSASRRFRLAERLFFLGSSLFPPNLPKPFGAGCAEVYSIFFKLIPTVFYTCYQSIRKIRSLLIFELHFGSHYFASQLNNNSKYFFETASINSVSTMEI